MRKLLWVLGVLFAMPVHAEPDALVQAVQMPAWLQRGASVTPLQPGTALNNDDRLITGDHARVLLQSADGSQIRLGENAALTLSGMARQRDGQSLFSAVLDVARGAFRFTTGQIAKLRGRDVTVRVAGATLGIRGTDVWGKVGGRMTVAAMEAAMGKSLPDADKEAKMDFDVVCLIEGRIQVEHAGDGSFVMDQPRSFYVMRKDRPPYPVSGLSAEQLAKWSVETEIVAPAAYQDGKWKVTLLSSDNERAALSAYDAWRAEGYAVRLRPVAQAEGWAYRLNIEQLASRGEAEALARQLTGKLGADAPVVSR
ncbi:MAG: FecR domain-containing protein [Nitrosomonadales bacterium]|nr:FecR domain-containing protein [Nitrosomonadales bacterium]